VAEDPVPPPPGAAPSDEPPLADGFAALRPPPGTETAYQIKLDRFEGPLDLLLHLIRKHEIDILDIPVAFITERYLAYLDMMRSLQIDVASEYLVMAAELVHLKSRMLLPAAPADGADEGDEPVDPRAELVRRLLEYQKYKDAGARLGRRATLGRDVFGRGAGEPVQEEPPALAPPSVFALFDAFAKVLERAKVPLEHEVLFERVSLTERIVELTELLHERRRLRFEELFLRPAGEGPHAAGALGAVSRFELVLTFLALLEMCKMRIVRVTQEASADAIDEGVIEIELAPKVVGGPAPVEGAP
jgi:segregation and condensation protein A